MEQPNEFGSMIDRASASLSSFIYNQENHVDDNASESSEDLSALEELDEEEDPPATNNVVVEKLNNNINIFFDNLELGDEAVGCDYIDLIRALAKNTTVRYATITSKFLAGWNEEEMRIMLEVIGGLPYLETLTINYPVGTMETSIKTVAKLLNRSIYYLREFHLHDWAISDDECNFKSLGEALKRRSHLKKVSITRIRQRGQGAEDNNMPRPKHEPHQKDAEVRISLSMEDISLREDGTEEDITTKLPPPDENEHQPVINLDDIANSLASLPNLEEVHLSTRYQTKWENDSRGLINDSLEKLCMSKALKTLRLNHILLESSHIFSIAEALLSKDSSLVLLQMNDCGLDEEGWRSLASILPENKTLQHLNLSQCPSLCDDDCFAIASFLEGNDTLKILQLQSDEPSSVTSRGVASLFQMLEHNRGLERLGISFSANDAIGFKSASVALSRNATLKRLYLENHNKNVSTVGVVAIANTLKDINRTLEKIAIIFDGTDDEGVIAFAEALQSSKTLQTVTFGRGDDFLGDH